MSNDDLDCWTSKLHWGRAWCSQPRCLWPKNVTVILPPLFDPPKSKSHTWPTNPVAFSRIKSKASTHDTFVLTCSVLEWKLNSTIQPIAEKTWGVTSFPCLSSTSISFRRGAERTWIVYHPHQSKHKYKHIFLNCLHSSRSSTHCWAFECLMLLCAFLLNHLLEVSRASGQQLCKVFT